MVADIGGMLASGVIKVLLKQIGFAIGAQIKLHGSSKRDLEKMKTVLESVEAVLNKAEKRSITDAPTRLWLKRLEDAMYDISYMLDDFEAQTDLWSGVVKKITMPYKMKKMRERLENITEEHKSFSLNTETSSNNQQVPDIRETAGAVEEANIFGRTDDQQKILAQLTENATAKVTFLPIHGIGGIGKTTLARSVYHHPKFKEYSRVWIYVSQTFDLKKIGNTIISQLVQGTSQIDDLHSIQTRLRELLVDKKILIILDDLWEKKASELAKLKGMLEPGEGSKLIAVVTTRDEEIASEISLANQHHLSPLTDDMCWNIIKQKCNFEYCPDKERFGLIGMQIANKCGGVALAAQSIGYTLKQFENYDEWVSLRDSQLWNLPTLKDTSPSTHHEVLASLLLSYNVMPSDMKLCFAYCAIFPKGHAIIKSELIHQWIALGFMDSSKTLSPWQMGDYYVKRLLMTSFLQHSKERWHEMGFTNATRFVMHDLVHDLARSVMDDEFNLEGPNCRYAWLRDGMKPLKSSTTSPAKLRALHCDSYSPAKYLRVLHFKAHSLSELPTSLGQLKQLRYLSAQGIGGRTNQEKRMNLNFMSMLLKLNYINLSRCRDLSALPESIGNMKDLMYLDLSNCKNMKKLPRSFAKLKGLVYLDLSGCGGVLGIHEALGGLTKLQHLNLSYCQNLRGLPEVISKLNELRCVLLAGCMHYIFDNTSIDQAESFIQCICMLPNMGELDLSLNEYPLRIPESASHLRKLVLQNCSRIVRLPESVAKMHSPSILGVSSDFLVHADGIQSKSNFGLLEHINPVWLDIRMLENVKSSEEAHSINLSKKERVESLKLKWTVNAKRHVEDMELLSELVPPTSVTSFVISGYGSVKFPDWLMSYSNYLPHVVTIEMWDLPNCKSLPPLAQLPNLRHLKLVNMVSLEEWNTTNSSGLNEAMFPKLQTVRIGCCPKLRIKPHLPKAIYWRISKSDNVLMSSGESMPDTGASSSSFRELSVEGSKVPLHQWIFLHHLPALSVLTIRLCSDLTSSPENTRVLHSLKSLCLSGPHELLEWLFELTFLQQLKIESNGKLEELPDNMRQLTQLQSLTLFRCDSLRQLPQWLGELTSLQKLEISCCGAIVTLPESIQQLTNLQELQILGSPELNKWCEAEENKNKLGHIQQKRIEVDIQRSYRQSMREYEASVSVRQQHTEVSEDQPTLAVAVPQHCGCLGFMGLKGGQ